jgi:hypothetical protein
MDDLSIEQEAERAGKIGAFVVRMKDIVRWGFRAPISNV